MIPCLEEMGQDHLARVPGPGEVSGRDGGLEQAAGAALEWALGAIAFVPIADRRLPISPARHVPILSAPVAEHRW